ncbi:MAG: YetF domain-containing protein [Bacteroidota bacterium]
MKEYLNYLLGFDDSNLEAHQMAVRAAVVFFIALTYVRTGGLRMLGRQSAFDSLTALMLGAILGKAVISPDSFLGTLLAALVIMVLHRLVAWLTFKSSWFGSILKGKSILLFENNKPIIKNLSRVHITENDLQEAVRKNLNVDDMSHVKEIYMDRSGELSVIKH